MNLKCYNFTNSELIIEIYNEITEYNELLNNHDLLMLN